MMHALVTRYAEFLSESGLSAATVEAYTRDVQSFLDYLELSKIDFKLVDPEILKGYREHLVGKQVKENSVRRVILALRSFYRYLESQKIVSASALDNAPIPQRIDKRAPAISATKLGELFSFALTQTPEFKSKRDSALLALLSYEGLKVNELIDLKWSDFIESKELSSMLHIGGPRPRTIELAKVTAQRLAEYREVWLQRIEELGEKSSSFAMFNGFKGKDSHQLLATMSRHGVKFILYEVGNGASVSHLNSEMLRHHAVQNLFSRGMNSEQVMAHLGLRQPGIVSYYRDQAPSATSIESHISHD